MVSAIGFQVMYEIIQLLRFLVEYVCAYLQEQRQ